jgi:ABC-type sugar transport system ATPase subunit
MGKDSTIHPLARMSRITKRFGPVTVLQNVDFEVRPGEVHILAGENGAGKSTLIKILAGVHTQYDGKIDVAGRRRRFHNPTDAVAAGVAVIHQELSLIGSMSIADNLFLARHPGRAGFVSDRQQHARARTLLDRFGLNLRPETLVETLPTATQQLLEIAKALSQNARVIVMDEPTSSLNAPEAETLFSLIDELTAEGCGVVYISHRMEEIQRLADRITVLRDGELIGTAPAEELPPEKLVQWMVGRDIRQQFPPRDHAPGEVRLEVSALTVRSPGKPAPVIEDVSLAVRAGEVLGIAGLEGSGKSELLESLFGATGRIAAGEIRLDGRSYRPRSPRDAMRRGLALLTNDRKETGLVLSMSVAGNLTLPALPELSCPMGFRRSGRERTAASRLASLLGVRAASLEMDVGLLSGGNQQKVALGKWLATRPGVLLLDEPTRGVDVGAKRDIYEHMNHWTAEGLAILLVTSELPELLALSDRILILHRGRAMAILDGDSATPQAVLHAAMGREDSQTEPPQTP